MHSRWQACHRQARLHAGPGVQCLDVMFAQIQAKLSFGSLGLCE
jgi:hypothetical protein